MKKLKKLFLAMALVLFASTAVPVIGSVAKLASAAPESSFSYLTVENFQDEANVGSDYTISDAKVWDNVGGTITENTSATVTVTVQNPLGEDVPLDSKSFEVEYVGDYSIIYTYGDYSQALTMNAVEGIYSFKFEKNSKQMIPAYVNIQNYTGKIVLPNPTVVDEDGKEIENANVVVNVLPPSATEYLNNEKLVKNADGFYEFTADVEGNWTINYLYKSVDDKVLASTTKSFTANKTYNNNYKLEIVPSANKPTTAITGVTTTLPTVTGKNAVTGDEVEVYYEISAKKVVYKQDGEETEDVTSACIANSNEFTPNQDGDYIITYTVKNFFGTKQEWAFEITNVKDTQDPAVKLVKPYTTTPSDLTDASYNLVEKAGLENIVLPAIWAEDNVDKAFGENGLTLTRKITKSNNEVIYNSSENPNKELVFNYNDASYTLNADTQVEVTLGEGVTFGAGTYTVAYIAKDSAGNEVTAKTFRLVLQNGFADDEDPEVNWSDSNAMPTIARVGDKVKFATPVVSDNVSTRIKLVVEYQFGSTIDAALWEKLEAENNQYSVVVENAEKLFIRATATDAYNNSKEIVHEVEIHETNDTKATTIHQTEEVSSNVYTQNNAITLRDVVYYDDYADYVQVGAYVTVEKDEQIISIPVTNLRKDIEYDGASDLDVISVSGAQIWASYDGDYEVAYVSKDIKNNYTIMFYSFSVAANVKSTEIEFTKLPTTLNGGKLELGETFEMPRAEVSVPEGYKYSYNVRLAEGPASEQTVLNRYEFTPAVTGTYVIEYYASVKDNTDALIANQPESVRFTVEVEDTTKPVIGNVYVEPVVALDYKLVVPKFTAKDLNGIDVENSKVTLRSASYGTKTWKYNDTTTNREVTLSYNEVYTLTFTVKDLAGNEATLVKEIKVGDTDAPVITVNEEDKDFGTIKDKVLTLDLSLVSVSDLIDTNISKENLVITVTRDGEKIANIHGDSKTNYEYNVGKAGEYTVTLEIKDAAGNSAEKVTRKYTVSASSNNGVDKNEVIGTILIVISVLLLAGVIVYFVVSKKKADKYKVK